MPRCIALKTNGTQCKCNALIGSSFCGTHQDWTAVFQVSHSSTTYDEEYNDVVQDVEVVEKPQVSVKGLLSMFDIIRR